MHNYRATQACLQALDKRCLDNIGIFQDSSIRDGIFRSSPNLITKMAFVAKAFISPHFNPYWAHYLHSAGINIDEPTVIRITPLRFSSSEITLTAIVHLRRPVLNLHDGFSFFKAIAPIVAALKENQSENTDAPNIFLVSIAHTVALYQLGLVKLNKFVEILPPTDPENERFWSLFSCAERIGDLEGFKEFLQDLDKSLSFQHYLEDIDNRESCLKYFVRPMIENDLPKTALRIIERRFKDPMNHPYVNYVYSLFDRIRELYSDNEDVMTLLTKIRIQFHKGLIATLRVSSMNMHTESDDSSNMEVDEISEYVRLFPENREDI